MIVISRYILSGFLKCWLMSGKQYRDLNILSIDKEKDLNKYGPIITHSETLNPIVVVIITLCGPLIIHIDEIVTTNLHTRVSEGVIRYDNRGNNTLHRVFLVNVYAAHISLDLLLAILQP